MIQLHFLQSIQRWLGAGWHCGFTSQKDSYPTLDYHCPFCKKESAWVAGINGFNGKIPKVSCCTEPVAFPIDDAKFAKHLLTKPRFQDGVGPREVFIDTWENGHSGKYEYEKSNPVGVR